MDYPPELNDMDLVNLKASAVVIWSTYDDQFGYATEKIGRVLSFTKVDAGTIVGMFDHDNQKLLYTIVNKTNKEFIRYWTGGLL